ncbi:MAG TPA: hypothetical protein VF170_01225 [Planctomycetaceae bacterium]
MSFTFSNASSVVVGTFNIYIFQPNWIGEVSGVDVGAEGDLQVDFAQPGLRVSFAGRPMKWTIRPDRLLLQSEAPATDCGSIVARVLRLLPLTPVRAAGNNLTVTASPDDPELGPAVDSLIKTLPAQRSVECERRVIGGAIRRGDATYNMVLTVKADKVDIDVNAHRSASQAAEAEEAARLFHSDCRTAAALATELFGVRITPWWE